MSDLQTPSDSTDTSQSSLLTPSEDTSTGTNSPRNMYENCTPPTRPGYHTSKSDGSFGKKPETIESPSNKRRKRGATFTALHEHKNDKSRPGLGTRTWTASTPDVLEACEGDRCHNGRVAGWKHGNSLGTPRTPTQICTSYGKEESSTQRASPNYGSNDRDTQQELDPREEISPYGGNETYTAAGDSVGGDSYFPNYQEFKSFEGNGGWY